MSYEIKPDGEGFVWAISSGCYSDYGVLCICPSKSEAEALKQRITAERIGYYAHYDDLRVEPFKVVDSSIDPVEILSMQVEVWDDGSMTKTRQAVRREWPFDSDARPLMWRWVRAPIHDGQGGRLEVSGTDHERVRRVFSDRRAQVLADDAFRMSTERKGRR